MSTSTTEVLRSWLHVAVYRSMMEQFVCVFGAVFLVCLTSTTATALGSGQGEHLIIHRNLYASGIVLHVYMYMQPYIKYTMM